MDFQDLIILGYLAKEKLIVSIHNKAEIDVVRHRQAGEIFAEKHFWILI